MKKRNPGAPHIGIIFTQAGLGGNSFNDLALEGVRKAAEDFGITYDQVEPKSVADEEIIQDEMASSEEYDLIICVGDEQVDALENVASVYTDQKFALLDATSDLPNVASYSCKAQEGSFMVGALAVLANRSRLTVSCQTAILSDSSAVWTTQWKGAISKFRTTLSHVWMRSAKKSFRERSKYRMNWTDTKEER